MKNVLKLLIFIAYTVIVFFTTNYYVFFVYLLFNLLVQYIFKVKLVKSIYNIIKLLPFIMFATAINILLGDVKSAILIGIRLLIVCNITYSFKNILSSTNLANAIEILSASLKIFNINPKDVSLVICICFAYIPILTRELSQIKYALKSKGMKIKITNYRYVLQPFLVGVFKRTNEISYALKAKGYMED